MKSFVLRSAAVVMTMFAVPSHAAEVAGWDIVELDDSCAMSIEYEGKGGTQLVAYRNRDKSTFLLVTNDIWSAKEGESYQVSLHIDEWVYGPLKTIGAELGAKHGFGLGFGAKSDFFETFTGGRGLDVYLGGDLIDELSLTGTQAAGAATDRCLARLDRRLSAEEKERARYDHLPDDPFKSDSPAITRLQVAKPPVVRSMGFSGEDYPSAAQRAGEQGTVVVGLTIGTNGRASSCSIQASSGSSTLDTATCRFIQTRSRFTPAEDTAGNAMEGVLTIPVKWFFPEETPVTPPIP